MRTRSAGVLVLIGLLLTPGAGRAQDQPDWNAITAAAREMARQVDFFQQVMTSDNTLNQIQGLYGQTVDLQLAVGDFRDQLRRKVSREKLYLGYDTVERKVKGVLDVIKDIEKLSPTIQLGARALQTANYDLHFAVVGTDNDPNRKADVLYRQTLTILALNQNTQRTVEWLYTGQETLKAWSADLKGVRQAVSDFQQLQQKKATAKELKDQFAVVNQAWNKVIRRYKDTPEQERILLLNRIAKEDQVLARLGALVGVKTDRTPLVDTLGD